MEVTTLLRGVDPCRATCRGNLQSRRSQLNREIHRGMRLRVGAENLLRATNNRTVKETAALELSFVNSHLKLLREQLNALNSNLEIYQGQGHDSTLPMIPLGLKETRDIDFREPFKDFILEHYSEDGNTFDEAIRSFMELRQAVRRPARSISGIQLLLKYLGVLYYVERRFFPADRNIGIFFEWYDALTGVSSIQRTVAFEKASVLFNLAALYTQIGSKKDRHMNLEAADGAIDNFLRAAGILKYVCDHFTHPPSFDLSSPTLDALTALLLAQARECHFEKQQTMVDRIDISRIAEQGVEGDEQIRLIELAQESQLISDEYTRVSVLFSHEELKEFIPAAWSTLVQVKMDLYKAVAHHYISTLLMSATNLTEETMETFRYLYTESDDPTTTDIRMPNTKENAQTLGCCHLRQSMTSLEDASRHARMNRELRGKPGLQSILSSMKDKIYAICEKKNIHNPEELDSYLDPPPLIAATKFQLEISSPDLSAHIMDDPFKALGPLSFFSAKRQWTQPRHVTLHRRGGGFGLSVKGSAPVVIASVEEDGSPAEIGGVRPGDAIVGIFGKDARWLTHEDIVTIVKAAGDALTLRLVTPLDPKASSYKGRVSPHSTSSSASLGTNSYLTPRSSSGSSSGGSMGRKKNRNIDASPDPSSSSDGTLKKLTRSLFRRSKSSEQDISVYKSSANIR